MLGLVLGGLLACVLTPAAASTHQNYRTDGWRLSVNVDRFAEQIHCALAARDQRMIYQPGAIGFRPARGGNTSDAWYRVDGGTPVRWQDRSALLIGRGVHIDGPALDDPTGGWVWVPVDELSHARTVEIRIDAHDRVRAFRLRGFAASLDAAHRLGCVSDASFES